MNNDQVIFTQINEGEKKYRGDKWRVGVSGAVTDVPGDILEENGPNGPFSSNYGLRGVIEELILGEGIEEARYSSFSGLGALRYVEIPSTLNKINLSSNWFVDRPTLIEKNGETYVDKHNPNKIILRVKHNGEFYTFLGDRNRVSGFERTTRGFRFSGVGSISWQQLDSKNVYSLDEGKYIGRVEDVVADVRKRQVGEEVEMSYVTASSVEDDGKAAVNKPAKRGGTFSFEVEGDMNEVEVLYEIADDGHAKLVGCEGIDASGNRQEMDLKGFLKSLVETWSESAEGRESLEEFKRDLVDDDRAMIEELQKAGNRAKMGAFEFKSETEKGTGVVRVLHEKCGNDGRVKLVKCEEIDASGDRKEIDLKGFVKSLIRNWSRNPVGLKTLEGFKEKLVDEDRVMIEECQSTWAMIEKWAKAREGMPAIAGRMGPGIVKKEDNGHKRIVVGSEIDEFGKTKTVDTRRFLEIMMEDYRLRGIGGLIGIDIFREELVDEQRLILDELLGDGVELKVALGEKTGKETMATGEEKVQDPEKSASVSDAFKKIETAKAQEGGKAAAKGSNEALTAEDIAAINSLLGL